MKTAIGTLSTFLSLGVASASAVPPTIHVTWQESPPPNEGFNYFVDNTNPDFPNVELKSESLTWQIWSTDPDNPNGVGDIGVISSPHPQNFGVKIQDQQNQKGARDVKGIILDPTNTANYSTITGNITKLAGDMVLQESSGGSGGSASGFTISGDVTGDITLTHGAGLTILGK